jgi:hypothetical protein
MKISFNTSQQKKYDEGATIYSLLFNIFLLRKLTDNPPDTTVTVQVEKIYYPELLDILEKW